MSSYWQQNNEGVYLLTCCKSLCLDIIVIIKVTGTGDFIVLCQEEVYRSQVINYLISHPWLICLPSTSSISSTNMYTFISFIMSTCLHHKMIELSITRLKNLIALQLYKITIRLCVDILKVRYSEHRCMKLSNVRRIL